MACARNHAARSCRSHRITKSVVGNINRTNYIRSSDSYSGKNYAVRLGLFKKWLAGRRAEKRKVEGEEN